MADERRRIITDSFNPVTLELLQNYALINSQNEGEFVRNVVQDETFKADREGILDKSLTQLALYVGKELEDLKQWLRELRKAGMSNTQIMNKIEQEKKSV